MFGIQWVMPSSVADLLFGWGNWFGKQLLMHKYRDRYWYNMDMDMRMGMGTKIQHFLKNLGYDTSRIWKLIN